MKQSSKTLRKMLAIALCVATIGSAGIMTEVGTFVGLNTSVSAADLVYSYVNIGNFQYNLYSDGTATMREYVGTNKDYSTSVLSVPSSVSYDGTSYTVTKIFGLAFDGCKIKELDLPYTLKEIGGAMSGASNIYKGEIGSFWISSSNQYFSTQSGVLYDKAKTTLLSYPTAPALAGNTSATVRLDAIATKVGRCAFEHSTVKDLTLPDTFTNADSYAFYYSNLTKVTFESSLEDFSGILRDVFLNAKKLSSINIKGTNGSYSTDSYGVVYNKDKTTLMYCPEGRTSAFSVNSDCKEIANYAFKNSNAVPVIYDNVTKFNYQSFGSVGENFKAYCLKDSAVESQLKAWEIDYTYIYEYQFNSDNTGAIITKYNGPYTVPSMPATILGKPVVSIGDSAFMRNTTLDGVYLSSTKITSIGDSAFSGCTKLKNIYLPSTVTSIGQKAFYNTAATSITIPSSMTAIGDYTFYGMSKLESISIPSKVTKIGSYAFGHCKALTSVTIPNNVTSIGFGAFYNCTKLSSLTIGSGVTSIGGTSFCNTALTSQYIPKTVTSIGSYAFGYKYADSTYTRDSAFTEISGYSNTAAQTYAKNNNIPFKSLFQYSTSSDGKSIKIEKYTGTDIVVVIPDKIDGLPVTSIARYAFDGTNVTKITLPSGMTALDGYALYGASKLTTVVFPSGLTSIGDYAFEFCTSLKSITIPNTVTSIGNGAFYACNQLASVNLGTGVKTIGDYAFENTALTSVTIPKSVIYIGNYAFGDTWANNTHTMVDGFQITGYAYTAAETYANKYSITFNPLYESITNTSTISKTAITLGQSVTVNASATGGKTPFQYGIMYSVNGGDIYPLQGYSSNATYTFTPTTAGKYTIFVTAKDNRGYWVEKELALTVETPAVKNTSTLWIGGNQGATEMYADDSVGLALGATGGNGSYKYSVFYHLKGSSYWYTAIEDTTRTNISFRLTDDNGEALIGDCQILVTAKDTDGKFESKTFNMTVYEKLVNTSVISATTIDTDSRVVVHASATGGSGAYKYYIQYYPEGYESWEYWESIALDTTDTDFAFKLYNHNENLPGNYVVVVEAYDSNCGSRDTKKFTVTVEEVQQELTNTSYISDENEEITLGQRVYVTPAAEGGAGGYTYAVLYKKSTDEKWSTKQDFSANTEDISLLFTEVAAYNICVEVKDADGTVSVKVFDVTVEEAQQKLINESTISPETTAVGKKVIFTGKASGGTGDYQYAFLYKKASENKWVNKQSFAANDTVSIKPEAAVDYDVCIKVKDSSGTVEKKYFTLHVNEALESASTISSLNIGKGQTVTVSAAGKNGVGPYTYSVLYKQKSKTKWTTKQDFSQNSQIEVKPASTGLYDVCVKVKDSLGTIAKTYFEVNVAAAVTSNSTISATEIKKGESVTVKAAAKGGIAPYTYSVQYKQQSKSKWTTQQDFAANDTIKVTPASTTTYDICVKVQDGNGTIGKQYFTVTVK